MGHSGIAGVFRDCCGFPGDGGSSALKDRRIERCRKHSLQDILVISICGFICGVDHWVDRELFGNAKLAWFRTFLELPNGIPSHDTFGRVFSLLEPEAFARCFTQWVQSVADVTHGQVVAIDGKAVRRSFEKASQKSCVHVVNAWAAEQRMVLGQVACAEKSNEITAIPQLLDLLALKGCIVTLDAMGCQRALVAQIVQKGADYVICLKGNQEALHEAAKAVFAGVEEGHASGSPGLCVETFEEGHGRVETRRCWVSSQVQASARHEEGAVCSDGFSGKPPSGWQPGAVRLKSGGPRRCGTPAWPSESAPTTGCCR